MSNPFPKKQRIRTIFCPKNQQYFMQYRYKILDCQQKNGKRRNLKRSADSADGASIDGWKGRAPPHCMQAAGNGRAAQEPHYNRKRGSARLFGCGRRIRQKSLYNALELCYTDNNLVHGCGKTHAVRCSFKKIGKGTPRGAVRRPVIRRLTEGLWKEPFGNTERN